MMRQSARANDWFTEAELTFSCLANTGAHAILWTLVSAWLTALHEVADAWLQAASSRKANSVRIEANEVVEIPPPILLQ